MHPFGDRDTIDGELFDGLDLATVALEGRELYNCEFRNCKLNETTWKQMRLEACRFVSCDLTRASVATMKAHGVEFRSCKLMGIDWIALAAANDLEFHDCSMRYCSFVGLKLRKLAVSKCAIIDATFVDVDLMGATFDDCDFTNTSFNRCEFKGATFPAARGLFIDPRQNRVKGVKLPLESAVLLAHAFGMDVIGYSAE